MPVDPLYIEETDDWLGNPTPLETCRHQILLYENEVAELNLQLRQAREKIFKLVEMHAEVAGERDALRSQLTTAKSDAADADRRGTEIENRSNWQLMAMNKELSELYAKLRQITGKDPRTGLPID
ncbi:hypothetical protein GIW70_22260 [Pseudomonas syringae]|nr:hypothetical protein [Pseudomonas syringae]MCF5070905.1 hypothetical protein [Pseudomonas syringae]